MSVFYTAVLASDSVFLSPLVSSMLPLALEIPLTSTHLHIICIHLHLLKIYMDIGCKLGPERN